MRVLFGGGPKVLPALLSTCDSITIYSDLESVYELKFIEA